MASQEVTRTPGSADARWQRFNDWRDERPFYGGSLLLAASTFMFYVTLSYAPELVLIGDMSAFIGLIISSFVFLTGVFALTKPEYSTMIGYVGLVLSFISLMGTLGGLFIGMFLGIIGSNLCIAWESDDIEEKSPFSWRSDVDESDDDDESVSKLTEKWR